MIAITVASIIVAVLLVAGLFAALWVGLAVYLVYEWATDRYRRSF